MNTNRFERSLKYLLVILMSFSSLLAVSQVNYNTTNWRFSSPTQFGFTLQDLDFFDNNVAVAVGGDGGIARTTDGGNNWTYGPLTFITSTGLLTKPSFSDVHFVTSSVVYAVGNQGCMVKSTDGGVTWNFITTPLYANAKNINAVWFVDANKGYIGGQWNNTSDSIPKLYVTNNGGATWDSIAAPVSNGTTKVGFVNNATYPSINWPITAKAKEIQRIEFLNNNIGYICGGGASTFPGLGIPNITSTTTCALTGAQTTGSHNASLLWKFDNGTLIDYSISKERLGYTGYPALPLSCTSKFGTVSQTVQQFRALNIINDSLIVMMSFNNNVVVRVRTGKNDSTQNINLTGVYEKGKYEILNTGPAGAPPGYPAIPAVQVLNASNPYQMKRAANGKLFVASNFGRMSTSVDTGRNWVSEVSLPQGKNYSAFATWAMDITPGGKFVTMGQNGVVADSSAGTAWRSNYNLPIVGAYTKMDFADCNNGTAAGGGSIAITNDGGKTWFDRTRPDFVSLNISINSLAYVPNNPAKIYFTTSTGSIYKSDNINLVPPAAPVLDPLFANGNEQMFDVATIGPDSVWACGYSGFSVPAANRSPKIVRSTNAGLSWTTISNFPVGTISQQFTQIEFPNRLTGYVAGNRDTIWKTTDGGVTWSKLPLPTPGVTPQITYTGMFALDANTVYLTGNGFPRKVVFKTTDGGNTWQDITNNILTLGGGNLNSVLFHDINNGYVVGPGGVLYKTTNGGASWVLDIAPTGLLFNAMVFAPKSVPAGTPISNRKLFVTGPSLPNVAGHIMEYGTFSLVNVSSTEALVASCDNAAQGIITINPTGGIAPYTYSIDGVTFQSSNTFSNLTPGPKTITIKDAACGIITKTVTVPTKAAPAVSAGVDQTIVEGDNANMLGSSTGNPATIGWTPAVSVVSGGNTFTPVVKPPATTTYIMTVTDANGCISSDNVIVTVLPYCLKVMNAFTPNGDAMNDKWIVTNNGGLCVKQVYVTVFNRYGHIVYKNDNYNNNWEGTYNSKPVPDGTYYYAINYLLMNGAYITLKGDVTILR